MKQEYSPYKLVHHNDKIEQLRRGEQIIPTRVQLVIADLCNHNCSFCSYRMDGFRVNQNFGVINKKTGKSNNNPNRTIPFEKVIEILDDCEYLKIPCVEYTGGGEPTVHRKHREIFEYTYKKGLELALVTNGYLLKDGVDTLLSNAAWVRFSMDAGSSKAYSKIREVPITAFSRFLKNVGKIVSARERNNGKVVLGMNYIITEDNYLEIYEAVKIAKDLGVDNMKITTPYTPLDEEFFSDIYTKAEDSVKKAILDFKDENFMIFDIVKPRLDNLVERPDYVNCGYMQFTSFIGGDQNVYTCCSNAYNNEGNIGSIKNSRFRDFWKSEQKKKFFTGFDSRKCETCPFNSKNKLINYMLEDNPMHVNFI